MEGAPCPVGREAKLLPERLVYAIQLSLWSALCGACWTAAAAGDVDVFVDVVLRMQLHGSRPGPGSVCAGASASRVLRAQVPYLHRFGSWACSSRYKDLKACSSGEDEVTYTPLFRRPSSSSASLFYRSKKRPLVTVAAFFVAA